MNYLKFWWSELHWVDLLKTTPVFGLLMVTTDPLILGLGVYTLWYIWTLQVSSLVYGHGLNSAVMQLHELYQRNPELFTDSEFSFRSDDPSDS